MAEPNTDESKLPPVWQQVQSAIWLVGIAILFWQGWWWPGILILAAISGLVQAAILAYVNRQAETRTLERTREVYLPQSCPNCGGPISKATVRWTGSQTAACPYCGSSIKAVDKRPTPVAS
jgi:hypothetical protein